MSRVRSRLVPKVFGSALAAIAALFVVGCRHGLAILPSSLVPFDSSIVVHNGDASGDDAPSGFKPRSFQGPLGDSARPTPALPRPIDGGLKSPAMDSSEIADYLDQLYWQVHPNNTHVSHRDCRLPNDTTPCPNGQHADVMIQAENGMHLIEHDDFPFSGRVVARMRNLDSTRYEAKFHLPPLRWVYWLVERVDSTTFRSRFFYLTPGAAQPVHFLVPEPRFSAWRKCPGNAVNRVSKARFQWCPPHLGLGEGFGMLSSHDTGSWISCAHGCCVSAADN
jgi:hypothetical protein